MRRTIDSAVQRRTDPQAKKTAAGARRGRGKPAVTSTTGSGTEAASDPSLAARDQFIAARISHTLQNGELGLVFLGAAHRIEHLLAPDIRVRVLTGCLPG